MQSIVLMDSPYSTRFGAETTCPPLTTGAKFTADILGIPWQMEVTGTVTAGGFARVVKPVSTQVSIPKSRVPSVAGALIERNLAYYLPRVLKDFPDLIMNPVELLRAAKLRAGLYPGKANFDKYRTLFGSDLASSKYTIIDGAVVGPRKFSVLTTLPFYVMNGDKALKCGDKHLQWDERRVLVAMDNGASIVFGLYDPPDKGLLDQLLSPISSLAKLVGKTINMAVDGIEAVLGLLKVALGAACKLAQGPIAQLTDAYIKKLSSMESQIASGQASASSGAVSTTGTVSSSGSVATSDVAYYNTQVKSLTQKFCGQPVSVQPPPLEQPKSLLPYFLIGGGVLTAATLAAIGIRRRR